MAGFDEELVREYFELNGFLVRQLRKYRVQARQKRADEQVDLLVYNPGAAQRPAPESFQLFSQDLAGIHRALVVVKGWHTSTFTPRMLKSSTRFFDFLKKDVLETVEEYFGEDDQAVENLDPLQKILVLPGLPSSDPGRSESISLLRENGVSAIITFRTILDNLLGRIEVNQNYQKSRLLHLLRILKIYGMVKAPQMELFADERRGTRG